MPTQKIVLAVLDHVVECGDKIARAHVAAAQPGRGAVDPRHLVDPILPVLTGDGVAERRLDLASQVIARGRQRVVHPLEDRDRPAVPQRLDDLAGRKRPEHKDRQAPGRDPQMVAQIVDRRLGGLHVATHADQ